MLLQKNQLKNVFFTCMQVCVSLITPGVSTEFSTGDMLQTPERLRFNKTTGQVCNKHIPVI